MAWIAALALLAGCGAREPDGVAVVPPQEADAAVIRDGGADEGGVGAADTDRDGDRIPNEYDECPEEPEVYNGRVDWDGCPDDSSHCGPPKYAGSPEGLAILAGGCSPRSPEMVWNGRELALVWSDERFGAREVLFARLTATGELIDGPVRITESKSDAYAQEILGIAWSGEGYGVVWIDMFPQGKRNTDAYFASLTSRGKPRGKPRLLTESSVYDQPVAIAWTGTAYAVVYTEIGPNAERVFLQRFSRTGRPLGERRQLSSDSKAVNRSPSIAWTGSRLGVVWEERERSYDGELCSTFDAAPPDDCVARTQMEIVDDSGARVVRFQPIAEGESRRPKLIWDGTAFVLFTKARGQPSFRRLDASGGEISEPVELAAHRGFYTPREVISTGDEYVIGWGRDNYCGSDLLWRVIDTRGELVGEDELLSLAGARSFAPALTRTSCGVAAAWIDSYRMRSELAFRVLESGGACPDTQRPQVTGEVEAGCPTRTEVRYTVRYALLGQSADRVFFAIGTAAIEPNGHRVLDNLAKTLLNDPKLGRIQASGHASDDEGSRKKKIRLSRRRAAAVVEYLVERGVEPERLSAAGYGDLCPSPWNEYNTMEDREKNRRVELHILEYDGATTDDRFACRRAIRQGLVPEADRKYLGLEEQ